VVVILGILASIGIPQFAKTIEKAKSAEARAGLGHIQVGEKLYYIEKEKYYSTNILNDINSVLDVRITDNYWTWAITITPNGQEYTATATRKTGPPEVSGKTISMDASGVVSGTWPYL
jgi:Tfp pilus assembly protein PilE